MNPSQALAETLVDELVRCGVQGACLAPGSRSAPLANALERNPGIELHVLIDERSAGFFALGLAKGARRPMVVATTSGTAAANLHPAVTEAHESRVPLIVLTADRPPELRGTAANQTIDQIKLYGDAVRWFCEVGAPDGAIPNAYWQSLACRAFHEAASGEGPVHLNVALREPLTQEPRSIELLGRPGGRPWTEASPASGRPRRDDVRRLASRLSCVERGLIVAGATDITAEPIVSLAQALRWPLLAEPTSNLRWGDTAVSSYEALLRAPGFVARHKPDFVLRLGRIGISRALIAYLAPDIPQVLVDRHGDWLDPGRSAEWILTADPTELALELADSLTPRSSSAWLGQWMESEQAARSVIDGILDTHEAPSEPGAARDLARALPDHSTLVAAASMPVRDLDSFMAPRQNLRVVGNRGANGIDGFVSTALGVAAAVRSPTAALCGDLSLLHDQNGLLAARDGTIDCVFVVLNNDGGGIFSFLEHERASEDFERLFGTPHGIDFATVAELYDCGYERMESAGDLEPTVTKALGARGVHIIEVSSERAANRTLHQRIWDEVAVALRLQ